MPFATGPDYELRERAARNRRQAVGYASLTLLFVLMTLIVVSTMHQARLRQAAEVEHLRTQALLDSGNKMQSAIQAASRSARGFMISGNRDALDLFHRSDANSVALERRLRALASGDAVRTAEVERIAAQRDRMFATAHRLVALQAGGDTAAATAPIRSGETDAGLDRLLSAIDRFVAAEADRQRAHAAAARDADRRQEILTYSLAGLGFVFLIVAGSTGFNAARAHARSIALSARLHHMAMHDELTGLYNRRQFFELLQRERNRAERNGQPLAVALVDVDHFKRINDAHGHQAGDLVLKHVARLLTEGVRASDLVGRIGGEEFAVALPDTGLEDARAACERLRIAVARTAIVLPSGVSAMLTISTGVAVMAGAEARDSLLGRADHALYAAKARGRNQVRFAA